MLIQEVFYIIPVKQLLVPQISRVWKMDGMGVFYISDIPTAAEAISKINIFRTPSDQSLVKSSYFKKALRSAEQIHV